MTSKKKIAASVGAVGLAAVIALGGTFAWQSISQTALNEAMDTINPGGRLHDDFNGSNKNVYVENFTKDGTAIFARVRLDEYMEIGNENPVSVVDGALRDDKTTWTTRTPDSEGLLNEDETPVPYWTWKMGGQGVYMPTFNMNKDSLAADINGTYEGTKEGDDVHYDDYEEYEVGQTAGGDEVYDADTNDADEGEKAVEGENIHTVKDQTHTADLTGTAKVITMQEWIDGGCQIDDFWVWDEDGWAYWARPIKSGETTGLLLDEIIHENPPSDSWYYGINVVGQFVTADDIGFLNGTGFYDENAGSKPTGNAEMLLEKITGTEIPAWEAKRFTSGVNTLNANIIASGDSTSAVYAQGTDTVVNITGGTYQTENGKSYNCVWAVDGATVNISGGDFSVGSDEKGEGNAVIYAYGDNSNIYISGGFFHTDTAYNGKYYVLNVKNDSSSHITVSGGTFVNFNPADGDDVTGTSTITVAEGYKVVSETKENDDIWYTVVPE